MAPIWPLLRARLKRSAIFMLILCSSIAIFLKVAFGGTLLGKAIYSFSIGMCCWTLTDGARLLAAWWLERARLRRGLAPSLDPLAIGWRGIVPLLLLGTLVGPAVGLSLGDALTGSRSPSLWSLDSATSRVTLVISLIATVISVFTIWMQERLATVKAQAEAARHAQAQSQLRLLQSQLEPHMLFNTLSNLRALIALDAPRAQAMLDRLIAYLRATLQASRANTHPLSAEFERLADYLALMQVRMGSRLRVQLDLPDELRDLPVPPLILQPLVENSIQHGLEPKVEGGQLRICARRNGASLQLSVVDDGVGGQASEGRSASTGFGLEQVRSRLATLYGEAARFELMAGEQGMGTVARIDMPVAVATG